MKKVLKKENLIVILGVLLILFLFLAGRLIYNLSIRASQKKAEETINKTLDEMSYADPDLAKDEEIIDELLSIRHLNDSQLGRLYERKSYVAYLDGNMLDYYEFIAKALFYLDEAGDYETACQVYTNLASYFYDLGNYRVSGVLMAKAMNLGEVSGYTNKEIALSAYRMYAKLLNREELPEEALMYIDLSKEVLGGISDDNSKKEIYGLAIESDEAKTDILLKQYDKAADYLEKYKDDKNITGTDVSAFYAQNFTLPYYDVKITLDLKAGKLDEALSNLDRYIQICDKFAFVNDKIDLMEEVYYSLPDDYHEQADELKTVLVDENIKFRERIITEHSEVLIDQLENQIGTYEESRLAVRRRYRTILIAFIIIMVFAAAGTVARLLYLEGNTDALTGLRNRRAFDVQVNKYNTSGKSYGAIMIDIDKFKNFNDTYGHEFGDLVLAKIAGVIKLAESKTAKAFRYGGEEMIVLIETDSLNTMVFTAEHIRKAVERCVLPQDVKVTVSTGVAVRGQCKDPIKEADENLYYAKHNGRNATGYSIGDERKLAQS